MEHILEIENIKVPLSELSKEEIIDRINSLQRVCSQLRVLSDDKSCQIDEYKKELYKLRTLEKEYINEIESLQTAKLRECENLKFKIVKLEGELNGLSYHHAEEGESLDESIFKKDEEICLLQDEIQSFSITCNFNNDTTTELDELQLRNTELKYKIDELNNEIVGLIDKSEFLMKQHVTETGLTNLLQEELEKINENYKYKKAELCEVKQLNETLQDDIALVKQELETIQSKPFKSRFQTNSLFEEVDDKRLELQRKMSIMKSQYLKMKSEHSKLLAKIGNLTSTNSMLSHRWETELQDRINDNDVVEEAYRERIKLMEFQRETCVRILLNNRNISNPLANVMEPKFLENLLETKSDEMKRATEQNDSFFLSKTILSGRLRDSKMEIKNWGRKVEKLEIEIGKLRSQQENIHKKMNQAAFAVTDLFSDKLRDSFEVNTASNSDEKCLNKSNSVDRCNKENIEKVTERQCFGDVPKKVAFTNVIEHSDTNRNKIRKGCKIIHCKPMVLKKKT